MLFIGGIVIFALILISWFWFNRDTGPHLYLKPNVGTPFKDEPGNVNFGGAMAYCKQNKGRLATKDEITKLHDIHKFSAEKAWGADKKYFTVIGTGHPSGEDPTVRWSTNPEGKWKLGAWCYGPKPYNAKQYWKIEI